MTLSRAVHFHNKIYQLWNRNKNSYIGHSHKNIWPHLHIFACLQFLILNSQSMFNRNCYQEPGWLFQIRIVNMQKCVGAVVDICGSVAYTQIF
jgi:hypothetical protein